MQMRFFIFVNVVNITVLFQKYYKLTKEERPIVYIHVLTFHMSQ